MSQPDDKIMDYVTAILYVLAFVGFLALVYVVWSILGHGISIQI